MLLLPTARLAERRRLVAPGGPLAPLAASLAADLAPVVARPVWLPAEKARLSRTGGRCPSDGTLLTFDPCSPRRHTCPRCGGAYDDEAHYRWWVMGYHLWLAERAVHAAVLFALLGDPAHARFATRVLDAYADAYLAYPNRDNVLGPSRPFFSTYLEALWLLHVCVALDALRAAGAPGVRALSSRVRERVVEPSRALVASYDEGTSNRQVWNGAAYLAASSVLGRAHDATRTRGRRAFGLVGLERQATAALLADGSWYEGDNYHQFAHRGLWYALSIGARAGWAPGAELARRFAFGFAAPFRVALPDLTLPARRDAQYGVTLRQWRWAEWCELGLAWPGAPGAVRDTLGGALATLYAADGAPARDTGRWRATGESERNEPPARLSRAALGWKSLLFASAESPAAAPVAPRSVLLDAQGLAVFRRDAGRLWVGFDFGTTGGGHGHPDRLNVLLADGPVRWLDDMGTGSYVERALYWYRSTLAHQAPLVDGRSQARVAGRLLAYEERDALGWADAEAEIAPGVRARRVLVVAADHVVDVLTWESDREVTLDLPLHVDAELHDAAGARLGTWHPADPGGAGGLEDGFDFLCDVEAARAPAGGVTRLHAHAPNGVEEPTRRALDAWVSAEAGATWLRAIAPGPPGAGDRRFVIVRSAGARGRVATVWSPRGAVRDVERAGADSGTLRLTMHDGRRVAHGREGDGWRVVSTPVDGTRTDVWLRGVQPTESLGAEASTEPGTPYPQPVHAAARGTPNQRWASRARVRNAVHPPTADVDLVLRDDGVPLLVRLGKGDYRRSEDAWAAAGRPRTLVRLACDRTDLRIGVDVQLGRVPHFASAGAVNDMDNERADVNSDGVQLYLRSPGEAAVAGWLLVPEAAGAVRTTSLDARAAAPPLAARWMPRGGGWQLDARVLLAALAPGGAPAVVGLDLVINEMPDGRERRRGQLVLSGRAAAIGAGAFVYLRGDRHEPDHLVRVALPGPS